MTMGKPADRGILVNQQDFDMRTTMKWLQKPVRLEAGE